MNEPFGYFKAEPFGWTDCAETDEGAVALYELSQLNNTKKQVLNELIERMAGVNSEYHKEIVMDMLNETIP